MAEETPDLQSPSNIIPINIEDEMRGAYIDYSMSVIISRALPDVRDGLKPVHRRVLFGMAELGVNYNKPHKKSARIVGEVLGKYHPHGDSSVYDTMVRMAQDWSLRYPLVDGQGNFGSIDGDSPAAMRYTEARLKRIADELLSDIYKETVNFQPNFDDSLEEPSVMPAKLPNLLLNGSSGIAVGMATNMAPHNLTEIVNGIMAYLDNYDITVEELMQYVKAPDFPTGATIYGMEGVKSAFMTGRGRVVMRANATIEENKGKTQIIVTDVPYMVNKAVMLEKTAELINDKKIEGIMAFRDESDRDGLRVVYDLRKDAIPNVVLNNLYKHTSLQSSFSINNVALVKGRPMLLNLKDMMKYYVEHRFDVITRRTEYELREAEKRAHILEGLLIALDNIDAVIELIRSSRDPEVARTGLMERFSLSDVQAKAILEMRLQRLTGLERDKLQAEYDQLMQEIADLKEILASEERKRQVIKDELTDIRSRYGDERRTQINPLGDGNISDLSLIADEDMVITISHEGYIKRTPTTEYRSQSRGGVGAKATGSKEEDFTEHLFTATMHNTLLAFTQKGRLYWLPVYELPEGSRTSKGRPLANFINIESDDKVRAVINVTDLKNEDYINNNYLVMCTRKGTIKKTMLEAYSRPRQNGIIAITIDEDDQLIGVCMTNGDNEIVIASSAGKAVRFHETRTRPMGRTAAGVRGISLDEDDPTDHVIGMVCIASTEAQLLVVSEKGYGKRSDIDGYRITNRGAKGVGTLKVTEKVGRLVAILDVADNDDLMIINKSGIAIRTPVADISVIGRNTQGVRLINLRDGDAISSVTKIKREEVEEVAVSESVEPIVDVD
ncbi:DNA gyrase subunit A [Spirosoma utsteinense]|uniref:DNA gyrase subunit A n=1 Tax=Spirosoma utsteinense TaxID=2585773 RepID=A0ABR6WB04_9BACT|nr:DNA gyrase subunit A [Spirosoma utsteinense]MBC3785785.1 DNA gyrase subunit A [Spirosoma utsteinense]MBC3793688.1 DNA gyrase subunit A [Spirosoma utsteinense]